MKTVLITGASRGIGRACALRFAKEGYHTYLTCSQSYPQLLELQEEITNTYQVPCHVFQCDGSNPEQVAALFSQIPQLDVLVNNAGISCFSLLQDMTPAQWHQVLGSNLDSVFYTCRLTIPLMLAAGKGSIVNVSSMWGNVGSAMECAYSASKGGVNALTRALAKELAPSQIPVNAIAFGVIDTQMNQILSQEDRVSLEEEIPMGRFGSCQEAADLIFQTAHAPVYLTGQVITMDGGLT